MEAYSARLASSGAWYFEGLARTQTSLSFSHLWLLQSCHASLRWHDSSAVAQVGKLNCNFKMKKRRYYLSNNVHS